MPFKPLKKLVLNIVFNSQIVDEENKHFCPKAKNQRQQYDMPSKHLTSWNSDCWCSIIQFCFISVVAFYFTFKLENTQSTWLETRFGVKLRSSCLAYNI